MTIEYYINTSGSSNKWYIIVDLENGQYLRGYGSRSGSGTGSWSTYDAVDTQKKRNDLRREYQTAQQSDIPNHVIITLQQKYSGFTGKNLISVNGVLQKDKNGTSSTSTTPPSGMSDSQRRKLRNKMHRWI